MYLCSAKKNSSLQSLLWVINSDSFRGALYIHIANFFLRQTIPTFVFVDLNSERQIITNNYSFKQKKNGKFGFNQVRYFG